MNYGTFFRYRLEQSGGSAFTIGAEFRSSSGGSKLFEALDTLLQERTGSTDFDIVVNNAGIGQVATIDEITEESFDEVMNINAKAPLFLIQQALPRLRDEGRMFAAGLSTFGRWAQTKDIADIATFLASPDSRWITGQLIDASGGSHL